jgi:uncharacterized protein YecE (DUF72 family)
LSTPARTSRGPKPGRVRIGISGWRYAPWRGTFYPKNWPHRRELEYASRQLRTIEINGSFYSLQSAASWKRWAAETPDDFVFSVKGGRFITHIKRLRDVETPLANFFASGILRLGKKLGPILWQLPPSTRFDPDRLAAFFELLPRDLNEAAALARKHDDRLGERASLRVEKNLPLRHALEVRHPSFEDAAFVELLREHRIALVVADTAGKWPFMEDVTADFVYARLHGEKELYVSGYPPAALADWARKIRAWARGGNPRDVRLHAPLMKTAAAGRDVFVYFDNDVKVRAPFDAMSLAHLLGLGPKPARAPRVTRIAETPRTRWPEVGPARRRERTAA